MAKFLATVLTDPQIKEGLSLGTQGAPGALMGLGESALTQKLRFNTLGGTGLINPLLSVVAEPIASEIKRQLNASVIDPVLGKPESVALNAVAKDTASQGVAARVANEILTRIPGSNILLPNQKRVAPGSLSGDYGLDEKFNAKPVSAERAARQQTQKLVNPAIRRFYRQDGDSRTNGRLEELMMTHRFYLWDITMDDSSVFEWSEGTDPTTLTAGFNYCSSLSMSVETESIKEGTWEFVREVPTKVTTENITLRKGMVTTQTGFYIWLMNALQGVVTRRTLRLVTYGRSGRQSGSKERWDNPRSLPYNRVGSWKLVNCIPVGYAISDWDADAKAIQMAELTIACELIEEENPFFNQGARVAL